MHRAIPAVIAAATAAALVTGLLLARPSAHQPRGATQVAWITADGPPDEEGSAAVLDLRSLNERRAGDGGFIGARDGHFVQLGTGTPIRFWGVNVSPQHVARESFPRFARMLARRGVNLVRLHAAQFDTRGQSDPEKIAHALALVEALKDQGIYSYLSIYYPLWLTPAPDTNWLSGYDGQQHPFAALMFEPGFQERYREWWRKLLLTQSPRTGRRLVDEPAVAGVEIQNEDSLLFPTVGSIPEEPLRHLESLFGAWLSSRYGSLVAARSAWGPPSLPRDAPIDGRMSLRPLWQVARDRNRRDQDTVKFLVDTEARFYAETYAFIRSLGFRGVIGTSNWGTADERVLGPLEKLVAASGDFVAIVMATSVLRVRANQQAGRSAQARPTSIAARSVSMPRAATAGASSWSRSWTCATLESPRCSRK